MLKKTAFKSDATILAYIYNPATNIQEPGALPVSQAAEVGVGKNVSHIHLLTMPGLKHEDSLELQISQKKECAKRS
ncbi:MAG TPA: hypothetical protein DHU55_07730 [Blastocatellia bacterium]|jgi:hypothetical protein|nr:hypothetical protein [Blastocatellia bacterium]